MSGHGARRDTVTSEGLDTGRKAGKIPRELTFGRGCSRAGEKRGVGWRKSPASGQDLLLALGYDLRQQGKVGRCGKSWLRRNGRAPEPGQLLPGLGHTSVLPERWERKVGDV